MKFALVTLALAATVAAEVYFKETFDGECFLGEAMGAVQAQGGLRRVQAVRRQDAKFYSRAAKFDKDFSNAGKPVVVQYTVKHEQGIDCGGGYVKVMAADANLEDFHGETPYNLMFGPDICGPTKKVHVIFSYKGKNHLIKKDIRCKDDVLTHLYTLILNPDNTYEVQIDGEKVESGDLESDWDMLPAKTIKDPDAKKPEDWDEREYIDDEADEKPADWEQPEHIADKDAKKPDDWDDEMDGEWEPPMIDNPEYKGEWKPKQIKNPAYKGKWIHPDIDNPEYTPDDKLYLYESWGAIGFDLWQVKAGTIFSNVIVTDSIEEAKEHAAERFEPLREAEKEKKEAADKEEAAKIEAEEKKRKEEEEKKKAEEKEDDDEEEEKKEDHDEL
ncbi:hypothetical protein PFISCL1PPCAC_508 [Pristionchus fissidentatus]|uniref:Calreticulin n=1 Tax=Pristionchus fissidentatus TaxID=1538716 RepID=A0AAV5UQ35_9BILA|nr:hypothetical protein PFISCL1PPCAC_508 [Pristionchus fissidentatus]